jgi:hypothetical protein
VAKHHISRGLKIRLGLRFARHDACLVNHALKSVVAAEVSTKVINSTNVLLSEVDTRQLVVSGVQLNGEDNGASFLPGDTFQIDDLELKILLLKQFNDLLRLDEVFQDGRIGENSDLAELEAIRDHSLNEGIGLGRESFFRGSRFLLFRLNTRGLCPLHLVKLRQRVRIHDRNLPDVGKTSLLRHHQLLASKRQIRFHLNLGCSFQRIRGPEDIEAGFQSARRASLH